MYPLCRLLLILTAVAAALALAALTLLFAPLSYWLLGASAVYHATKKTRQYFTAYGTARWAGEADLAGMLGGSQGLILGRFEAGTRPSLMPSLLRLLDRRVGSADACKQLLKSLRLWQEPKAELPLVRLSKAVHTAAFMPTGTGKGQSLIVPFLKNCADSMFVLDLKGENYQLTAEHRRRVFGHQIVVLDPFGLVASHSDGFNPIDFIDKDSPCSIDEAREIGEALTVRTGQEREPHWCDSAELWIAAMVAATVNFGQPGDRSLQTVRAVLADTEKISVAISMLCKSEAWGGILARFGSQLQQFKDKELSSTLTTTNRFLRFLDSPHIERITGASSYDPANLAKGKLTVYLVMSPEHMRAQMGYLRLIVGTHLRAVVRGGLQEANKVHFLLDESASLGHLDCLDDAVDKYRGYGVRLFFAYQSLGQLKLCFPEGRDQTLLSNCTQVFAAVNDPATAEYVSTRLGEATITVDSGGTSSGRTRQMQDMGPTSSTSLSTNDNANWQQHGRKLLKPEEVMALPIRTAITFTPNVPPIWTTLVRDHEEPDLQAGPGLFARLRSAVKVLLASCLLAGVAGLVAFLVTETWTGRGRAVVARR